MLEARQERFKHRCRVRIQTLISVPHLCGAVAAAQIRDVLYGVHSSAQGDMT